MKFSVEVAGREIPFYNAGRINPGGIKEFGSTLRDQRRNEVGRRLDLYATRMGLGTLDYARLERGRLPIESADWLKERLEKLNLSPENKEWLHFMAGWVPEGKTPEEARRIETFFGYAFAFRNI